jgi:hypothetical protein
MRHCHDWMPYLFLYRIENNIEECQAIGNPISAIPLIPKTGEKLP